MNILEYADILNLELVIRYYPCQDTRFCAQFQSVEVKDGGCLVCYHGNAATPAEAVEDYLKKIRGRRIVVNAMSDNRREYEVPRALQGLP